MDNICVFKGNDNYLVFKGKDNYLVFKGKDNYLVSKQIHDISWICEYNMLWYPFDTHKCSMEFVIGAVLGILSN